MKSFQQICPGCQSVLELPEEADGKLALCPSCQTQFTAAAAAPTVKDDFVADMLPRSQAARLSSEENYHPVAIETILGETRTVFLDRQRPMILPFLLPCSLIVLGLVIPIAVLNDLASTNLRLALIWSSILIPWFLLIVTYAIWFALRSSNELCDFVPAAQAAPKTAIRSWIVPRSRPFVALLLAVTTGILYIAGLACIAVMLIEVCRRISAFELQLLLMLGILIAVPLLVVIAGMRLWPLLPLAMIDRSGIRAVRDALTMTRLNLMSSFYLVAAVLCALGFGFSLFGIGLLVAIPLSALSLTIGFRLISGRRIAALENPFG